MGNHHSKFYLWQIKRVESYEGAEWRENQSEEDLLLGLYPGKMLLKMQEIEWENAEHSSIYSSVLLGFPLLSRWIPDLGMEWEKSMGIILVSLTVIQCSGQMRFYYTILGWQYCPMETELIFKIYEALIMLTKNKTQ